jgi:norsolorinic acid ketoreductase
LETYLARTNHVVIAAVRDPPSANHLEEIPRSEGTQLIIVKIDSSSHTDADDAVQELKTRHGINKLDIVIANAGISKVLPRVDEVHIPDLEEHFQVNLVGVVVLFKAVRSLLLNAEQPKFLSISSKAGSLGAMETVNFPNAAYGSSKATLNYMTLKIHYENERITAVALDPG